MKLNKKKMWNVNQRLRRRKIKQNLNQPCRRKKIQNKRRCHSIFKRSRTLNGINLNQKKLMLRVLGKLKLRKVRKLAHSNWTRHSIIKYQTIRRNKQIKTTKTRMPKIWNTKKRNRYQKNLGEILINKCPSNLSLLLIKRVQNLYIWRVNQKMDCKV